MRLLRGQVAKHEELDVPVPLPATTGPDEPEHPRPTTAFGFKNWPWEAVRGPKLPPLRPDGTAWPPVSVLTLTHQPNAVERTRLSVRHQAYPDLDHLILTLEAGEPPRSALRRAGAAARGAFVVLLADGEMLAPGALAAACLVQGMDAATVVAGMRIGFGPSGVRAADVIDACAPEWLDPRTLPGPDLLMARAVFERHVLGDAAPGEAPVRLSVMGRPMALQPEPESAAPPGPALSVAALTDGGAGGGASIADRRLADAMRLAGHQVRVVPLTRGASVATAEWVDEFPAAEAAIAAGGFDLVLAGNIHGATRRADVLARMHAHVPVATITHDLFLLTGRCDMPFDCTLIHDRCTSACPTPTHYPYLAPDRIEAAWEGKRAFLQSDPPPLLLANSHWAAAFTRLVVGPALGAIVQRIDLAFPTQVFRPHDRAEARAALGLPADDVLIMFAAANADDPRKGFLDVLPSLHAVARPGVGFVVIGRVDHPERLDLPNLFAPGPIADEQRLALWFAACDLHVTTSRYETLGMTPIEAGLCGTPTVAYRQTGLSTAVIDGVSGSLVDPNPAACAEEIARLVDDAGARHALGAWGRIALEARHSHAASYLSLLAAWRVHGLAPPAAPCGRVRFDPAIVRTFDGAADPAPGASGIVRARPRRLVQLVRRAKHAVWGRTLPLWMRRAAWVVQTARGR